MAVGRSQDIGIDIHVDAKHDIQKLLAETFDHQRGVAVRLNDHCTFLKLAGMHSLIDCIKLRLKALLRWRRKWKPDRVLVLKAET